MKLKKKLNRFENQLLDIFDSQKFITSCKHNGKKIDYLNVKFSNIEICFRPKKEESHVEIYDTDKNHKYQRYDMSCEDVLTCFKIIVAFNKYEII